MNIPFNRPYLTGKELDYIAEAHEAGHLSGDGGFARKCHAWLRQSTGCRAPLLTHSCTGALEMAAMLAEIRPGDEVIMPSYTFASTANAFVLRGATPVFIDIRPDTLNIDETLLEAAITSNTKAIVPVHYAGVACEMDVIMAVARKHNLLVIEDAAQGVTASYKGKSLGSIGDIGTYSFHETKNISSGEGGALLLNDLQYFERAEILREKGTNRNQFFRCEVDKYTWVDIGSSYLPSELMAAFLFAQMEHASDIKYRRLEIWDRYHQAFEQCEQSGAIRRPIVPEQCDHNAHMYYILLPDSSSRTRFIDELANRKIHCTFHYIPLHSSPMGARVGRMVGGLDVTDDISRRLVRTAFVARYGISYPYDN